MHRDRRPPRGGVAAAILAIAAATAAGQDGAKDPKPTLAELQPSIDRAIDRGIEFLLSTQQRDGSWSWDGTWVQGDTALSVYTLLKSGLDRDHSAVRRGLRFILLEPPNRTYEAGCCLMALEAAKDPSLVPRMEAILRILLEWQQGSFAYPDGIKDLSNTQYAALGLRAARNAGLKIPLAVWTSLAMDVFRYQEDEHSLAKPGTTGQTAGPSVGAGFRYRASGDNEATGSMTAAGIGTLALVKECAGERLADTLARQIDSSIALGVAWIGAHFSVETNPVRKDWLYYWLYGLERVGSLLRLDRIGGHDWYLEGARYIVAKQRGDGYWEQFGWWSLHDTCFALLFLQRASASSTGGHEARKPGQHAPKGKDDAVRLRGRGGSDGSPLTLWIDGFGEDATGNKAAKGAGAGAVRVVDVIYEVNDETIATVAGDPARPWTVRDSYPCQYPIPKSGTYTVRARVRAVDPEAPAGAREPVTELVSGSFTVTAREVHEPWMDRAAEARKVTVLPKEGLRAQASTENGDGQKAALAFDGWQGTAWCSAKDDRAPSISFSLKKPVRADTLVLGVIDSMPTRLGNHDVIEKVRVRVNDGKRPIEVALNTGTVEPTRIPLGADQIVQKIVVEVVERSPGKRSAGHCGFAEIHLEHEGRRAK